MVFIVLHYSEYRTFGMVVIIRSHGSWSEILTQLRCLHVILFLADVRRLHVSTNEMNDALRG